MDIKKNIAPKTYISFGKNFLVRDTGSGRYKYVLLNTKTFFWLFCLYSPFFVFRSKHFDLTNKNIYTERTISPNNYLHIQKWNIYK